MNFYVLCNTIMFNDYFKLSVLVGCPPHCYSGTLINLLLDLKGKKTGINIDLNGYLLSKLIKNLNIEWNIRTLHGTCTHMFPYEYSKQWNKAINSMQFCINKNCNSYYCLLKHINFYLNASPWFTNLKILSIAVNK